MLCVCICIGSGIIISIQLMNLRVRDWRKQTPVVTEGMILEKKNGIYRRQELLVNYNGMENLWTAGNDIISYKV